MLQQDKVLCMAWEIRRHGCRCLRDLSELWAGEEKDKVEGGKGREGMPPKNRQNGMGDGNRGRAERGFYCAFTR